MKEFLLQHMHEVTMYFLLVQPIGLLFVFGISGFAFRRLQRSWWVALISSGLTALYIYFLWFIPVEVRHFGHGFMSNRSVSSLEPKWMIKAIDVVPVYNIMVPLVVFLAVGIWHRRLRVQATPPEE